MEGTRGTDSNSDDDLGNGNKPPVDRHRAAGEAGPDRLSGVDPRGYLGCMLPDWVAAREEISFGAKVLFAYLVRLWNPGLRCAWPSQQNIATALGIRPRHVRNLVRELRDAKLVETQRRAIKPLGWRQAHVRTIYTFCQHDWMTGAKKTRTQQQQEAGDAALQDGPGPL